MRRASDGIKGLLRHLEGALRHLLVVRRVPRIEKDPTHESARSLCNDPAAVFPLASSMLYRDEPFECLHRQSGQSFRANLSPLCCGCQSRRRVDATKITTNPWLCGHSCGHQKKRAVSTRLSYRIYFLGRVAQLE